MKLAGTNFETKDDYDFNAVTANDALLLILQRIQVLLPTSRGAEGGPFEPLDFLQVGGPFREVGGRGLPWLYGNSSTGNDNH